jgi:hypothetical protein
METHYEVEMLFYGGSWENCWLDEHGVPQRFDTYEDALEELNSHLSDLEEAVKDGFLVDGGNAEDYRIIKVNREQVFQYGSAA